MKKGTKRPPTSGQQTIEEMFLRQNKKEKLEENEVPP